MCVYKGVYIKMGCFCPIVLPLDMKRSSYSGNLTGYFLLTLAQKGCRIHGWNRHNQQREVPPDNTFFPRVERWISHNLRRLLNE
mgnify:FL=1